MTKSQSRITFSAILAAALFALGPPSARATATLSDLLNPGASILCPDRYMKFHRFQNFSSSGDLSVSAADILVDVDCINGLEISFRSEKWDLAGPDKFYEFLIDFEILDFNIGVDIWTRSLEISGAGISGGGSVDVGSTGADNGDPLQGLSVFIRSDMERLAEQAESFFVSDALFHRITISNTLTLRTSSDPDDRAFVSRVDQEFSLLVVPEPSTLVSGILGVLAAFGVSYVRRSGSPTRPSRSDPRRDIGPAVRLT